MLDRVMQLIAPHYCYGCGSIGMSLCDSCKYDIVNEAYSGCLECGAVSMSGICHLCRDAYSLAWCVGERDDVLKQLIDGYKFSRQQASCKILAALLDATLPHLPLNTVVTSIPTVAAHVRQRGYDHAALVAQQFARTRSIKYQAVLVRNHNAMQRGASKAARKQQAASAFAAPAALDSDTPYLIIDDIVTTGATLKYAARTLAEAGATQIMVGAIARQPLK